MLVSTEWGRHPQAAVSFKSVVQVVAAVAVVIYANEQQLDNENRDKMCPYSYYSLGCVFGCYKG